MGLLLLLATAASAQDITTYFLNKNFDQTSPLVFLTPDIECLEARGQFAFPEETTFCFRSRPVSNVNFRNTWSFVLAFGTKLENDTEIREGFLFGVYTTGPWLGVKQLDSDTYAWIGGGQGKGFHFQVGQLMVVVELLALVQVMSRVLSSPHIGYSSFDLINVLWKACGPHSSWRRSLLTDKHSYHQTSGVATHLLLLQPRNRPFCDCGGREFALGPGHAGGRPLDEGAPVGNG